eukprot:TRINITY_DN8461_c0_g1_i1.p1 TRINITY_DN8461_c0_g1~~TRINITY_DN8461_c0_g1_i1.p1  ORF type:complete len:546 (+),score=76.72 TRINITY_DN8461_c0_g1_i1:75-1712(+)
MLKITLCVLFLISLIASKCQEEAIVNTTCGLVRGLQEQNSVWSFKGLPYAVPPVGELRWKPPVPLGQANKCWTGIYDATSYGSCCPQLVLMPAKIPIPYTGEEDCLYLNVWTPNTNPNSLYPVMVWIHGGGLFQGCSDDPYYGPGYDLAREGIVVVSLNYRLNNLGYLALTELSSRDPNGVSGNYGLLDQIEVLRWVQANIQNFGGDRTRVTVTGQSSGGTSIFGLLLSPFAKGLFHRVISMSGSPKLTYTLEETETLDRIVVERSACKGTPKSLLLECLLSLPAKDLANISLPQWFPDWGFGLPDSSSQEFYPLLAVDNYVISNNLSYALESGDFNHVDMIIGSMKDECDLGPEDVVIDYSVSQLEALIRSRFDSFQSGLGDRVLALYHLNNFASTQEMYDSISADLTTICGNIQVARQAAVSLAGKKNVYNYIASQFPSHPACISENYCSRYAFHLWDSIAMFGSTHTYNFTGSDLAWIKLVQRRFVEFMYYGSVSGWKTSDEDGGYNVIDFRAPGESVVKNARKTECEFWYSVFGDRFWWQN